MDKLLTNSLTTLQEILHQLSQQNQQVQQQAQQVQQQAQQVQQQAQQVQQQAQQVQQNRLQPTDPADPKPLPLAIAFSGGLDSRFLAYTAHNLGLDIQLYHFQGPQIAASETKAAQAFAKQQHIPLICIDASPLQLEAVRNNQPDRCYYCKKFLFSHLQTLVAPLGSGLICDGTNFSDLGQHRPGLRALTELNIQSPLALAKISKADIHKLAQATHLDDPNQLPKPCLLTRFPYNFTITPESLHNLEHLETLVAEAVAICYPKQNSQQQIDFRVRQDPDLFVHMVLPTPSADLAAETKLRQILQKHNLPLRLTSNLSGYFDAKT